MRGANSISASEADNLNVAGARTEYFDYLNHMEYPKGRDGLSNRVVLDYYQLINKG